MRYQKQYIMQPPVELYVFNAYSVAALWKVVDDIVMGGHSEGHFAVTEEHHGRFYGDVSTDGGGFSSVRHALREPVDATGRKQLFLRVKGDGSEYQFRIREDVNAEFSYTYPFTTSGDWQIIEIPLEEMYPVRRGDRLDRPNFADGRIAEIGFLIANGRDQAFSLLVDRIEIL
ncbi:CIA30 family protein [Lewinella sp. IMCC34183]|uniref:CIA30 family protein n=1 Tax=Lewinella sp. IMCC34183 TaxID=2248762 RepID=UPI000E26BD9D|nr:CIA30 family protein [Lewinella sp. IMCC34183]